MIRITPRTSRKLRKCEGCLNWIEKGDRYLEQVASPDHGDLSNTGWWRLSECENCAIRCGREDKLW